MEALTFHHLIDSFLGSGNAKDPLLLFISFDPTGEWPWDYVAELNNENNELQNEFKPLIDFALSIRKNGFITRIEEDLERPRWNQSVTVRVELEMKIIQTFSGNWTDLGFDQYYHESYRKDELSLSFFPIAPGWRQPFSPLLKKLFSLPADQFEYYNNTYSHRANLLSQYFATVYNNREKPIAFVFLPTDERKREYLLNWMKELGLFPELPDLGLIAVPNENGTIWIIPNADSAEIDYEMLRDRILQILKVKNPLLLTKLKDSFIDK